MRDYTTQLHGFSTHFQAFRSGELEVTICDFKLIVIRDILKFFSYLDLSVNPVRDRETDTGYYVLDTGTSRLVSKGVSLSDRNPATPRAYRPQ
jgi:hypothetical protein